jgi:hypothetical protein
MIIKKSYDWDILVDLIDEFNEEFSYYYHDDYYVTADVLSIRIYEAIPFSNHTQFKLYQYVEENVPVDKYTWYTEEEEECYLTRKFNFEMEFFENDSFNYFKDFFMFYKNFKRNESSRLENIDKIKHQKEQLDREREWRKLKLKKIFNIK